MRKLLSAVATAFAVLAFAGPASATESTAVVTEPGGALCTTSTCNSGISNSGMIELRGHLFGFESHSIDCTMSFVLHLALNGTGVTSNVSFGQGDADCTDIVPCATPWPFNSEERADDVSQMALTLCMNGTPLGECEGTVQINLHETSTNHRYFLTASDASIEGEGDCELTGAWVQSGTINGFEIVHP